MRPPLRYPLRGFDGAWTIGYNQSMKKVSAKRKLRQFTVVIEQDEDGYYVGGLAQTPWFGVCDVLKGHSSVGSSIQRVHTQD